MSNTIPVLRIMEIATGRSLEGGRQIRYVLDGEEKNVSGQAARHLEEQANSSMGMLGDLPAILVEYLNLVSTDGKSLVDAEWMTKEERANLKKQQLQKRYIGRGISEG